MNDAGHRPSSSSSGRKRSHGGPVHAYAPRTASCAVPRIAVLGMSIKTCGIDVREPFSFPPADLRPALDRMRLAFPEGTILSTCHRVELYARIDGRADGRAALKRFWLGGRSGPRRNLDAHLYYLEHEEAAHHLFSVASGLDSALLGEAQILGQVRDALTQGVESGATGAVVGRLFRQAVSTGRRVRNETSIGRKAASVSYAAVELANHMLGDLRDARVLLVGTGKMGELAARNLVAKGVAGLAVAGRTLDRAQRLALECHDGVTLAQLEHALPESDVVISCTSAPHYVINREMVAGAMRERQGRPLFLIDIAVPRDVEPAAGQVPGVHLFNIDDLQARVASNMRVRRAEGRIGKAIVDEEVRAFLHWLSVRQAAPTIAALHDRAEAIRRSELSRSAAVLARLPEDDRRRIEALTLALQKKLLHQPISWLRSEAATGGSAQAQRAVRDLFALDD